MQHRQYDVETHRDTDRTYYTVEKITRPKLSQVLMLEVVLKYNKLQLWIQFGLHIDDKWIQNELKHGESQNSGTDEEIIQEVEQRMDEIIRGRLDPVVWKRLERDYNCTPQQVLMGESVITEVLQNGNILRKLRPLMMWRRTGRPQGAISVYNAILIVKPSTQPSTAKAAQFLSYGVPKLKQNQAAGAAAPEEHP